LNEHTDVRRPASEATLDERLASFSLFRQSSRVQIEISDEAIRNLAREITSNEPDLSGLGFNAVLADAAARTRQLAREFEERSQRTAGQDAVDYLQASEAVTVGQLARALQTLDGAASRNHRARADAEAHRFMEDAARTSVYAYDRRASAQRWSDLAELSSEQHQSWRYRMSQAISLSPWPDEAERVYRVLALPAARGNERDTVATHMALGAHLQRAGEDGDVAALHRARTAYEAALSLEADDIQRSLIAASLAEVQARLRELDSPQ
jgi:hypothetical protein